MGNFTLNAIFATIFGGFAWNSLPRGWRFFKIGWLAFRFNAEKSNTEDNLEAQPETLFGSNFLIAGIAWLAGGLIAAILAVIFVIFAILGVGIFDFIS